MVDGLVQGKRSRAVLIGAVLFAAIFTFRFLVGSFGDAITFLYLIPTVVLAIACGFRVGLAAGAVSFALFLVWVTIEGIDVAVLGYADRAFVFLFIGSLVGLFADRLRALEAESTRHFSLSEDMICTVGFDGRFTRVNPAFERVLGYTEPDLIGRLYSDFLHPDDRDMSRREAEAIRRGAGTHQFRNRYLDKQGNVHWIEWNSVAIPEERRFYAVARDVTHRKEIEEDLEHLSRRDPLTGLLNRRSFDEAVNRELASAARHGGGGALLMIDVDQLKRINDQLGHTAGDQALREVARTLDASVRMTDVVARDDNSLAARVGGDEFAVLLPGADASGAEAVAGRLIESIASARLAFDGKPLPLSISVGMAFYDATDSGSSEGVLKRADRAMYAAKAKNSGSAAGPSAAGSQTS